MFEYAATLFGDRYFYVCAKKHLDLIIIGYFSSFNIFKAHD